MQDPEDTKVLPQIALLEGITVRKRSPPCPYAEEGDRVGATGENSAMGLKAGLD